MMKGFKLRERLQRTVLTFELKVWEQLILELTHNIVFSLQEVEAEEL
jgi:hypothetical protein